jgi:hypothetical protein
MLKNYSDGALVSIALAVFFLNVPIAWILYFNGLYLGSMTVVSIGTFLVWFIFYELETRNTRR